jgi:hypothetical protein
MMTPVGYMNNTGTVNTKAASVTGQQYNRNDWVTRMALTNSTGSASENAARVTRQQYNDYLTRFAPYEDYLINQVGNQEYQKEQVSNAVDSASKAYQGGLESANRNLARYGVTLDETEQDAYMRKAKMGDVLSKINAANTTRYELEEDDLNLASGLSNYGRSTLTSANELFGNAAASEASRNATNSAISRQNSQAKKQAAASLAMMAMMMM